MRRQSQGTPASSSPTDITSQQFVPPDAAAEQQSQQPVPAPWGGRLTDEPFQRFSSTFEGLISKLSAPLAFAGLPLGQDAGSSPALDGGPSTAGGPRSDRPSGGHGSSGEADLKRLYSPAALRAIRASNGGSPAESFYVVPTTGGTLSYASILTRAERETRRNSLEDVDEDFVDARETLPSPELQRGLAGGGGGGGGGGRKAGSTAPLKSKIEEELQMENQTLKHIVDRLSKRLHMWEVNSQTSSFSLQQSLKAMHHPVVSTDPASPAASHVANMSTPSDSRPIADLEQRIRDLESDARRRQGDRDHQARENEKLRAIVTRYRDHYEALKKSAKSKRSMPATVHKEATKPAQAKSSDGEMGNGIGEPPTVTIPVAQGESEAGKPVAEPSATEVTES